MIAIPVAMIGNAHIDPVWLWNWQEGYSEVRATFSAALDRLEEDDDVVFTMDSVCYLAWIEEHDPALFARIAARVEQGRWEIAGGMWIEPDCNLTSGESLARHLLYSQQYLATRFGRTVTVGLNADPFGHCATLPKLLAGAGVDSYFFLRPGPHEMTLPPAFTWEADDGSAVAAIRIPRSYNSDDGDLAEHIAACREAQGETIPALCFYGIGNHGGGPTRRNIESIHRLAADGDWAPAPSTLRDYVDHLLDGPALPVVRGDLWPHAVGCYSVNMAVKADNRRGEHVLAAAERWAWVAGALGLLEPQTAELAAAWKALLFNQFHDILPGSALPSAYVDARDQVGEAIARASRVLNRSLQAITTRIDVPFDEAAYPFVVFNHHTFPVAAPVEFEFWADGEAAYELLDADGSPVPLQRIVSEARAGWTRRFLFMAELPPLGYRVYRLHRVLEAPAVPAPPDGFVLDNGRVRVEIDPGAGAMASLRVDGRELLAGPVRLDVIPDGSDTWGHGLTRFGRQGASFAPVAARWLETGPVRQTIRLTSECGSSRYVQDVSVLAGGDYVEVRSVLDWHETHAVAKLRIPTTAEAVEATHAVAYGSSRRPTDGQEVPCGPWVALGTPAGEGVVVATDTITGVDVQGGTIGLTVVRSPVFAWHEPCVLEEDDEPEYTDQGRRRWTYRVFPGAPDATNDARAAALGAGPHLVHTEARRATEPPARSFAEVSDPDIALAVVKGPEAPTPGVEAIVRLAERGGRTRQATLRLLDTRVPVTLGPHQLVTLAVSVSDGAVSTVGITETPVSCGTAQQ